MGLLYQKRRLKVNKIRRQIGATRVMLQRLRVLLSLLMVVGISYFGIWVLKLPQWYIDSVKLTKADPSVIKIQGAVITPLYKIENMVRQTQLPYTQIFRLDTTELANNIMQLQSVKKVYIRRFWFPARLVIAVDERTPVFLLAPNLESEPNSALTADGVLIDHDYLPLKPSIKAKKLLTYGVRDGRDEVWNKKKVEALLHTVRAFERYSGQEVQYIDIRNQKDIYIMLKEYLVRFGEINETALSRAKCIASILPETKAIKEKIKYIDLRWDDAHYFRLEGAKEIKNPASKAQEEKNIQNKTDEKQLKNEKQQDKKEEKMPEKNKENKDVQQEIKTGDEIIE